MKTIRFLVFLLVCSLFILTFAGCSSGGTEQEEATQPANVENEGNVEETADEEKFEIKRVYVDEFGSLYAFTDNDPAAESLTYYERPLYALIQEWGENVASAELKYVKDPNACIITEGWVKEINKQALSDRYYIIMTADNSGWDPFGASEVNVYFNDDFTESQLINIKKGDYIALIANASNTSYFLENPELTAEFVLPIATDYNEETDPEWRKLYDDAMDKYRAKVITLMLSKDDIEAYVDGRASLLGDLYGEDLNKEEYTKADLISMMRADFELYQAQTNCKYADYWDINIASYYMIAGLWDKVDPSVFGASAEQLTTLSDEQKNDITRGMIEDFASAFGITLSEDNSFTSFFEELQKIYTTQIK